MLGSSRVCAFRCSRRCPAMIRLASRLSSPCLADAPLPPRYLAFSGQAPPQLPAHVRGRCPRRARTPPRPTWSLVPILLFPRLAPPSNPPAAIATGGCSTLSHLGLAGVEAKPSPRNPTSTCSAMPSSRCAGRALSVLSLVSSRRYRLPRPSYPAMSVGHALTAHALAPLLTSPCHCHARARGEPSGVIATGGSSPPSWSSTPVKEEEVCPWDQSISRRRRQ